jgi:hypothetical protein
VAGRGRPEFRRGLNQTRGDGAMCCRESTSVGPNRPEPPMTMPPYVMRTTPPANVLLGATTTKGAGSVEGRTRRPCRLRLLP